MAELAEVQKALQMHQKTVIKEKQQALAQEEKDFKAQQKVQKRLEVEKLAADRPDEYPVVGELRIKQKYKVRFLWYRAQIRYSLAPCRLCGYTLSKHKNTRSRK